MKVTLHSTERGNNPKTPTHPMSSWMEARRKKSHIFIIKLKLTKHKLTIQIDSFKWML